MTASTTSSLHANVIGTTTVLAGTAGETGPLYTRLLATDPAGRHRGALFLTAEIYRPVDDDRPAFPIWRSTDGGLSWSLISQVIDTEFGVGHRHQPTLYELPEEFAGLTRGTLLLAGNAIPDDLSSTRLVVYSSDDGGETWVYRSSVDAGGPAICDSAPDATTTSVWEPDLLLVDGVLTCFFADERWKDRGMHQVIAKRSTTDLRIWGEAELVKGVDDRVSRPGMFVTTGRMPGGAFGAVMEIVGEPGVPVSWLTSSDGSDWGAPSDLGRRLNDQSGLTLTATPNVHWRQTSTGSITIIATGLTGMRSESPVNAALVNFDAGRGEWYELALPTPKAPRTEHDDSGYSQSVLWNSRGQLVQATTVRNLSGSNDIVVTVAEVDGQ
jgi:hypothetical protein